MINNNDYFRIFLDSIDKMARKGLVPFIPEIDLDPALIGKVDLSAMLENVGIMGLCKDESDFSDLPSIIQALMKLSEYCAGVGAFAACRIATEMFLKRMGLESPRGDACLCLFDDEELDLSSRRVAFKTFFNDGMVTGKKNSVVLGGYGGPYAVFSQRGDDALLCLVEHEEGTVAVEETGLLGARALKLADVTFTHAVTAAVTPVSRDDLLGLFSLLSLLLGACACSSASKSLDIAREYARERYQGGSMIEEYDSVKLMIEVNRAALMAATSAIMDTAALFDAGNVKGAASCFRVKAAASTASVNAGLDAIQVHGGYGYMRDYGVEKRFRDIATLSVLPLDSTRLLLMGNALAG